MDALIQPISAGFAALQQWVFEALVQPVVFAAGQGALVEDAFDGTAWLLVGLAQLSIIGLVFGALQRWRPVEAISDRATIRTDMFYTVIHRLGVVKLLMFFSLEPLFDDFFGWLRAHGASSFHIDQVWPGVTDIAWVSFLIYLVAFDFVGYWTHRGQHHFNWWWKLHSLHHAQRQMTMWSDNRNHLLDDVLIDATVVLTAQLIGVPPGQFMAVVAVSQLSESFQHANVRVWFGRIGERLVVSPRFHRLHHAIGIGHESPSSGTVGSASASGPAKAPDFVRGGHNFGVLLPWWDSLFRTANYERRFDATGVRDQVEQGRDYGQGFLQQQWLGILRLVGKA